MQLQCIPRGHYTPNSSGFYAEDSGAETGCRYGYTFSLLHRELQSTCEKIFHVIESVFFTLKTICADPNAFVAVIRKFDEHLLALVEMINKSQGKFQTLKSVIRSTVGCINFLQIAVDIDYFLQAKFRQDGKFAVLGRLTMCVAHIGKTILWFAQMQLINLNKIATSLGNIRFFSKTIQVSLDYVTGRAFGIAHALFALDALHRSVKAEDLFQRSIAALELSAHTAEVVLDVMLVAGIVNVVILGMMAGICVSLETGVLLYKEKYK